MLKVYSVTVHDLASKKVSLIGEQLVWLVQLYPGIRLEPQEYT